MKKLRFIQAVVLNVVLIITMVIGPAQWVATAAPQPDSLSAPARNGAGPSNPHDETPPPVTTGQSGFAAHIGSGPYGPPDSNDATFTIDSAPTMDEYRFVNQSPIQFDIDVNRVVGRTNSEGYLLEPDKLISNGIILPKAKLQMMVYDVDEDYVGTSYVREIDKVYVNGHYVGDLSGANDTWSAKTIEIDVRYLKFAIPTCREFDGSGQDQLSACHAAPSPVKNQIRIDIDTGNNGQTIWAVTVDWAALMIDAARPILFVHGKGGSANGGGLTYWDANDTTYYQNFRGKFSSVGFLTGITENRLGAEATILNNAKILKDVVSDMVQRYGVQKINILAHSKGGLDSRAYISSTSLNPNNNVAALFTLATPNHGSYMANISSSVPAISAFLGNPYTDAVHDLTENYVSDTFNPATPARAGVRYYALAADAGADYFYGRDTPLWQVVALPEAGQRAGAPIAWGFLWFGGRYKGDNDYLVAVRSADWSNIPGHNSSNSTFFGDYDLNHHSIRAGIRQAGESDNRVANLVKGVFKARSATAASSTAQPTQTANVSPMASGVSAESALAMYHGTIAQGQVFDQKTLVDTNTHVVFSVLWKNGNLNLNLVDPNGLVITPSTADPNVRYSENRTEDAINPILSSKIITYDIITPVPGEWTMRLIADPTLPGGAADWVEVVGQESQISLGLETNHTWYPIGSTVTMSATLVNGTNSVTGAAVEAIINLPAGGTTSVTLLDDGTGGDPIAGDGVYTSQFSATQAGMYRLSATATGSLGGGGPQFSREASTEFQTSTGAALFGSGFSESTQDVDLDGMINVLSIHVPVVVTTPGEYTITGKLVDQSQVEMGLTNSTVVLPAGPSVVTLDFDGAEIAARGGAGAFTLVDLRLMNNTPVQPVMEDYLQTAYTTLSYPPGSFQTPAIRLNNQSSDYGVDTDANGKYDYLHVNLGINLLSAGYYYWNAKLADADGFEFGWSSGEGSLAAGANSLNFEFDGEKISDHKVNGPYFLEDISIWGSSGALNVTVGPATAAYTYTQFDPPPYKLYLPNISSSVAVMDTYEPNDSLSQAYGSLAPGATYTSYISSNTDEDYYYFDTSVVGPIKVELSGINSPTTDLDMEFLDASGLPIGGSYGTSSTETVNFQPVTSGRYYVHIYRCCGTNTPGQPYYLKVTYNQAYAAGDIWGKVRANNSLVAGIPMTLWFYDQNLMVSSSIQTLTNGSGEYHFRGVASLSPGQIYQPYYAGGRGYQYAGYAGKAVINSYSTGSTFSNGDLDISPINLISPNTSVGQPLPVQFTWAARSTSPSESYQVELYNYTYNQYWYTDLLGHVGSYLLTALPTGYVTGRTYYWRVFASSPDGSFAGSYYLNSVNFSTTSAIPAQSGKPPEVLFPPDGLKKK